MDASKRLLREGFTAAALGLLIFSAGCLCCTNPWSGKATTTRPYQTKTVTTTLLQNGGACNLPYIKSGSGCCLDVNGNGACDSAETAVSTRVTTTRGTLATTQATIVVTQSTTLQSTTPTTLPTTTTRPKDSHAACVAKYSMPPDTVLYLYTYQCCSALTPSVDYVASRGYHFRYIQINNHPSIDDKILSCFLASNNDIYVPQFICAGTGSSILLTNPAGAKTEIGNFAKNCNQSV
jgi:hypothetical protein